MEMERKFWSGRLALGWKAAGKPRQRISGASGGPTRKGGMSFEFKKKKSVRKAVRRLAQKQICKALQHLEHCEKLEAVHEVRKDTKQLRALLRLVRTAMRCSVYRRSSRLLRKAAAQLALARDSHVKVNALTGLVSHFKHELAPRSFGEIKRILAADCAKQQAALSHRHAARKASKLFKALSRDPACLLIERSGWPAIAPGIKRSYRDGRRGCVLAQKSGKPEDFHEWRKRAKDLYYQVGLLRPIWPEQVAAAEAELKHLSDCLGDDHDLFLLTERRTIKRFAKKVPEEAEALKAFADRRQRELRNEAFALGSRFYEEEPSNFCRRLRQYWKRWRREPKRNNSVV